MDSHEALRAKRAKALADIDNAKFSWFHAKICAVAGVGFFTDAYDIISIGIVAAMLGYLHGEPCISPCVRKLSTNHDLALKIATPVGNVVGQLLFGWLADAYGRKKMYGIELGIIIISTLAQAASGQIGDVSIIIVLTVFRFVMGIAIGGDYTVSATMSSEFAPSRIRGRMMAAVFACQGLGSLFSAVISFALVERYKNTLCTADSSEESVRANINLMWRLLIGLGAIPGCLALYFRLTVPETPRFTLDIEQNIEKAVHDIRKHIGSTIPASEDESDSVLQLVPMLRQGNEQAAPVQHIITPQAGWLDFGVYFSKQETFQAAFGATYSWFAVDVAFYSLLPNTPIILQATQLTLSNSLCTAPKSDHTEIFALLQNSSLANIIISGTALIPGNLLALLLVDVWGRRKIQLGSFVVLTVIFMILGFDYDQLLTKHLALIFVYCLGFFFLNFGPNTTTFILPGEIFPTRYRSSAYGVCAAGGKLGAIVAQVAFSRIQLSTFLLDPTTTFAVQRLLQLNGFFMISGVFSTLLLKETNGKTLEELSNEDKGEKEE